MGSQSDMQNYRRRLLATLLLSGVACAAGCRSTGQSLFSSNTEPATQTLVAEEPNGITSKLSGLADGARGQASSMSMAVKSAWDKGTGRITNLVSGNPTVTEAETGEQLAASDPLLLENKVTTVDPEVFVANGHLFEASGKFAQAMENYAKALQQEPENGPALASIARLHYRQENYAQSVEFFERAIKAQPNEPGLYNDMGLAFSKLGRPQEAVSMIQKAIEISPSAASSSRFGNNLATVQFEAGQEDAARQTLLKFNSKAVAHYNMAYLLYSANRTDGALKELGQVLASADSVGTDSASQTALKRSQELFSKLGGTASHVAQAVPNAVNAAEQATQSVAQVTDKAKSFVDQVANATAQISDAATGAAGAQTPPSLANQPVGSIPSGQVAPTAPPANYQIPYALPPGYGAQPAPAVAEKPAGTTIK